MSIIIQAKKTGVIVIGGHVQGLGVVRIFGKNNIPCALLDTTRNNITRHSKYCSSFYEYKEKALLDFLIRLGETQKHKNWLLIPTNDYQVKILSCNKKKLTKYFNVSTDKWENIITFYNKRNTYKMARDLGVDIPKTWFPNSVVELKEMNCIFPCIIKPAIMQNFYQITKKKVFICYNLEQLIFNYNKAIKIIPNNEIIVQEIIPGTCENQFSACFLFDKMEPLVQFVAKRKRQHPIDFGNATTYAELINDNGLLAIAQKILKSVSYTGVCEVEFKYDERDKKFKFLEVNTRTWKWHAIAEKSESPFLMGLYALIVNKKKISKLEWKNVGFKHWVTDLPTVLKLFSIGEFKKSRINNIQYAVWDRKDIKPGLFELFYLPYLIIKRG